MPLSVNLEQVAKYLSRKQKDRLDSWSEDQDNELYYVAGDDDDGSGTESSDEVLANDAQSSATTAAPSNSTSK